MKRFFLYVSVVLFTVCANAQITTCDQFEKKNDVVFDVESMNSSEIKTYNLFVENGMRDRVALMYINANRAYNNLRVAPPVIIEYSLKPEITKEDSIPSSLGAIGVWVKLINSSTKLIKEITLEFEFFHLGTQLFDIKTGEKYLVLKFSNLKGRPESTKYGDIANNVLKCMHFLDLKKASYNTLFYNKKATHIQLHSANIIYEDGNVSNKIAIWDNLGLKNSDIYSEGPLSPMVKYLRFIVNTEK